MASGVKTGGHITVPGLPGRWSVWADAPEGPGSVWVIPADDKARATGVKSAAVRIKFAQSKPRPEISLIRTEPPLATLRGTQ